MHLDGQCQVDDEPPDVTQGLAVLGAHVFVGNKSSFEHLLIDLHRYQGFGHREEITSVSGQADGIDLPPSHLVLAAKGLDTVFLCQIDYGLSRRASKTDTHLFMRVEVAKDCQNSIDNDALRRRIASI